MSSLPASQIEHQLEKLRQLSVAVGQAYDDQHFLVSLLNQISPEGRKSLQNMYQASDGKVTGIRKAVSDILATRSITFEEVKTVVDPAVAANPKSFVTMYKNWLNIFYPLLLIDKKAEINRDLDDFKNYIFQEIGHADKIAFVKFDFSGPIETGDTRTWAAFYNNTHPNQKSAKQLFIDFERGRVFYSLHDRKKNTHYPSRTIESGEQLDLKGIVDLFKANVEQLLQDNFVDLEIDQLTIKPEESLFKVSMSGKDISPEAFQYFMQRSLVVVHKDTEAKGTSYTTQGQSFISKMKAGDYFYICRGNDKLVVIGQITSVASPCEFEDMGNNGWVQRSYRPVKESVNKKSYQGESKWWTPNNNSTCVEIKPQEYAKANEILLVPYFKVNVSKPQNNKSTMSLNQILYGPPGTGKTYSTIGLSVKLIDGTSDDNHVINKLRFDELRKAGQIEFITFHQNYSYEDFMVGLRPDPNEDKLKFFPYKGAFYRIAQAARTNYHDSKENKGIKKDFDTILLEMFQPVDAGNEVEVKMASGISFYITDYNDNTIYFRKSNNSTSHTLSIATLKELVEGTRILNSGLIVYYNPLVKEVRQRQQPINEVTTPLKNFVLVIDEINRANISRVFGELITLLEEDKRLGQPNELTVSLPNGEINFGVPPNLYVLGTMNTADKSIALIDVALRRRFEFVGKYPDYDVLINAGLAERADLLRKINHAIFSKKNTADYLIGHAYFLSEQDISIILLKKIIPLLSEYFGNRFDDVKAVFNQTDWTAIFDSESYCWHVKKSEKHELAGANI